MTIGARGGGGLRKIMNSTSAKKEIIYLSPISPQE